MDVRTLETLERTRGSLYPSRYVAVYRERGYYVIHNLLNDAKRFYADPRDVAARLEQTSTATA